MNSGRQNGEGVVTAEDIGVAEAVSRGDVGTVARLIRDVEEEIPHARVRLMLLHERLGRAHVVGVIGAPGVGKSTLIDQLIATYRTRGDTVGVVAVDPSSPFGGGSILGDRVRMKRHATDAGVFIRSLAARGHLGGLSIIAADAVAILDAAGKDVVIIETVGTGQSEVGIMGVAHTVVLVDAPSLGDDVQAIKSGVLEIADVVVVNKADLPGADDAVRHLTVGLSARSARGRRATEIVKVEASRGKGIADIIAAIDRHREYLRVSESKDLADRNILRFQECFANAVRQAGLRWLESGARGEELRHAVASGAIDPRTAAQEAVAELLSPTGRIAGA